MNPGPPVRLFAGFFWLIEDLVNCLTPLATLDPIDWTDGTT